MSHRKSMTSLFFLGQYSCNCGEGFKNMNSDPYKECIDENECLNPELSCGFGQCINLNGIYEVGLHQRHYE